MIIIAKIYICCKITIIMNEQIDNTRELLEFYSLAGVDATCGDVPFGISTTIQTPTVVSPQRPASSSLSMSSNAAIQTADDICAQANSIDDLKKIIENFEGCSLKNTAANTVIGDGNPAAKIVFVGEAPGAEEDLIGKAFVGRSGQLLDKIMAAVGLSRSTVYICNILPWRPPGNRSPSDAEIAVCLPFVKKQIEIINPDYLLTLGAIATNSLLGTGETMSQLRGHWLEYQTSDGKTIKTLATYHPAYLLRTPAQKNKVWSDFLRFKKEISKNNQQPS